MPDVELSLCGLALLGVIVDRAPGKGATQEDLYASVPAHAVRDEVPGSIEAWPHDISEWIDELQQLLDRQLVVREAGDETFIYRPTSNGIVYLRAALHPRGDSMRSTA